MKPISDSKRYEWTHNADGTHTSVNSAACHAHLPLMEWLDELLLHSNSLEKESISREWFRLNRRYDSKGNDDRRPNKKKKCDGNVIIKWPRRVSKYINKCEEELSNRMKKRKKEREKERKKERKKERNGIWLGLETISAIPRWSLSTFPPITLAGSIQRHSGLAWKESPSHPPPRAPPSATTIFSIAHSASGKTDPSLRNSTNAVGLSSAATFPPDQNIKISAAFQPNNQRQHHNPSQFLLPEIEYIWNISISNEYISIWMCVVLADRNIFGK